VSPEEAIKCEDKFTKSKTVSMPYLFNGEYALITLTSFKRLLM